MKKYLFLSPLLLFRLPRWGKQIRRLSILYFDINKVESKYKEYYNKRIQTNRNIFVSVEVG